MDSRAKVGDLLKMVGDKIRLLREEKKYTQVELGKALGYTSSGTISQIENGARGLPLASMMRLAKILGVHPAVLISPIDTKDPDDLMILSKVIYLIEMKRERPKEAQPLLGAIKAIFALLPVLDWESFKSRAATDNEA